MNEPGGSTIAGRVKIPPERASNLADPVPEAAVRPHTTQVERGRERLRNTRLVAVFLLGCVGFAGPLLRSTSHAVTAGAWPLPFVYLFGFWLLLIVLIALALRAHPGD